MATIGKLFLRFDMHFLPLYYGLLLQCENLGMNMDYFVFKIF